MKKTKTSSASLHDIDTEDLLATGELTLSIVQSQPPPSRPHFEGEFILKGYEPDLSGRTCIIRTAPDFEGEVFLNIVGLPHKTLTRYKVFFQGDAWNSPDVFDLIG